MKVLSARGYLALSTEPVASLYLADISFCTASKWPGASPTSSVVSQEGPQVKVSWPARLIYSDARVGCLLHRHLEIGQFIAIDIDHHDVGVDFLAALQHQQALIDLGIGVHRVADDGDLGFALDRSTLSWSE